MRSFEIFVAPEPSLVTHRESRGDPALPASAAGTAAAVSLETRSRRKPAREVLDVFIQGANVTARVAESHASCVLRDLGVALTELSARPRGKAIVRFYDDAWELCVERFGGRASLSVYRTGTDPSVTVLDRWVAFDDVVQSARDAIRGVVERGTSPRPLHLEMRGLEATLGVVDLGDVDGEPSVPAAAPVTIEIDRDAPIAIGAEFALRPGPDEVAEESVERADLHALLFRGRLRAEIRGRAFDLGDGHPFLFAERFLSVGRESLDAWERGQPLHVRSDAGGILIGVRLTSDGQLALSLGAAANRGAGDVMPSSPRVVRGGEPRALHTFPALSVADVVEASLAFGRALVRAILRRDRSQCMNLRLSAFRRALRDTGDALREACQADAKINPTPEPYRAFAVGARKPASEQPDAIGGKLRYAPRWRAMVPGIDLRATFLCGERLIVGAAAETFCLDRATGMVNWRVETERALSVVTPGGIARIHNDGTLAVHDFGTGEITLRTWLVPRLGGPMAGAVVNVPGLPRLLILTEGERHLVAVDLTSGEPRWRFAWGGAPKASAASAASTHGQARGALRMKRGGKLLYFTSGDSALTALDVLTGAVVWRTRDRLRFRAAPTLDHDGLFALAGGVNCATQLHAIDPYSGHVRWTQPVSGPGRTACTVEGAPLAAAGLIAVATRDGHGLTLRAFDRDTGAPRWATSATIAPVGTSWLALDDLFIGNTPTGEIVAVESATGALRYRHVLGRVVEADVPRRLEPVLRSGALFVPHTDVQVLRPRDGALLGTISPCDAIPDLLRVDERCDVYVAEESGHLVAFGAGPRLSLVR
jgi:outer membrane protein assembly factor BamB